MVNLDTLSAIEGVSFERAAGRKPRGTETLRLLAGKQRYKLIILSRGRAPYPSELALLAQVHSELVRYGITALHVPYMSESVGNALVAAGWSWTDDTGNFDIRAPNLFLHHRGAATRERAAPLRLLHAAAAVAAVRWLVMTGERQKFSATELAQAVGVTQPRASQLLKVFTAEGLTLRAAQSQWSANRAQCLDAFLEHYPGPGGTLRYFYSLDEPLDVALQIARTMTVGAYALSADVGPDLLAPVRRPSHVVVYLREAEQVERMRWTTAKGAHDANIVVRSPADQSVFWKGSAVSVRSQSLVLAHPTQMLWDLGQLGEGDRTAAVEAMKAWILNNLETSSASKPARSPKT